MGGCVPLIANLPIMAFSKCFLSVSLHRLCNLKPPQNQQVQSTRVFNIEKEDRRVFMKIQIDFIKTLHRLSQLNIYI